MREVRTLNVGDRLQFSVELVKLLKNVDPLTVRVARIIAGPDGCKVLHLENDTPPAIETPGQLKLETS